MNSTKSKTCSIFPRKTFQSFTLNSLISSSVNLISHFSSKILSTITALQYSKQKAMAETNSQFNFDEDQEMETQPIYLSSDDSEIASPCSSPTPQLPNNVTNTYIAITQFIAATTRTNVIVWQCCSTVSEKTSNFVNLR